jgi:hypothetical protein
MQKTILKQKRNIKISKIHIKVNDIKNNDKKICLVKNTHD